MAAVRRALRANTGRLAASRAVETGSPSSGGPPERRPSATAVGAFDGAARGRAATRPVTRLAVVQRQGMTLMSTRTAVGAGTVAPALAATVSVGAVAARGDEQAPRATLTPTFEISVLNGAGIDASVLPSHVRSAVTGLARMATEGPEAVRRDAAGIEVAPAHRVATALGWVYLIASGGVLCVAEDGVVAPSVGCGPNPAGRNAALARAPGSVTQIDERGESHRVTAVLPDGTTRAWVSAGDGTRFDAPITSNVVSVAVEGRPTALTWTDQAERSFSQHFDG